MTGKYGMFDTAAERDAWVAERDRRIAADAAALARIGITGPGDLADKYADLCSLFEAAWHHVVPESLDDLAPVTSDDARTFAWLAIEVMSR